MKYDGQKKKSSFLNSTVEKPITLLKNPAIDGKEVKKSSIDILGAKYKQKKVRVPKIKKDLLLSKTEIKQICSIGLPKWQENKLQKLSAEKLKERHGCLKEEFNLKRMMFKQVVQQKQRREGDSRNNCQVRGLHQIIKIIGHGIIHILCLCLCGIHPLVCNGYPLASYFDPWCGSLSYGGLPNYFTYR